jgi:hypothetical protein
MRVNKYFWINIKFSAVVYIHRVHCAGLSDVHGASQYVAPRGGIYLGKWRSAFTGSSDGKINVQSACSLNTRYIVVVTGYFKLLVLIIFMKFAFNIFPFKF